MFDDEAKAKFNERKEDAEEHGGWWKCTKYEHIKDEVCIEFIPGCYARALSNGSIVLGNLHPPGETPDEEEIFTAIAASTNQIAIKSGFGRYLSIDSRKHLVGLSEAIGEPETFLPVFEDSKLALCSSFNDCFLSPDEEVEESQPPIVAKATKVGPYEILNIRINNDPMKYHSKKDSNTEEEEDLGQIYEEELNFLKKYQSHGDKKMKIKEEDKEILKIAKKEGSMYETLLDKRVKLSSDKYCK